MECTPSSLAYIVLTCFFFSSHFFVCMCMLWCVPVYALVYVGVHICVVCVYRQKDNHRRQSSAYPHFEMRFLVGLELFHIDHVSLFSSPAFRDPGSSAHLVVWG